jgi:hypothetical protein
MKKSTYLYFIGLAAMVGVIFAQQTSTTTFVNPLPKDKFVFPNRQKKEVTLEKILFIEPKIGPQHLEDPNWIKKDTKWFQDLNHGEVSSYLFNIFDIQEVLVPSNTHYLEWQIQHYKSVPIQVNAIVKENKSISVTYMGRLFNNNFFEAQFSTRTFFEGFELYKKYLNFSDPDIKVEWLSAHTSNEGKSWDTHYKLIKKFSFVTNKTIVVLPYEELQGCFMMHISTTTSIDFENEKSFIEIVESYIPLEKMSKYYSVQFPIYIQSHGEELRVKFEQQGSYDVKIWYNIRNDKFGIDARVDNLLHFAELFAPELLKDKKIIEFAKPSPERVKIGYAWNDWQIYGRKSSWAVNLENPEKTRDDQELYLKIENGRIKIITFEKIPEVNAKKMINAAIPYQKLKKFFKLQEKFPNVKYNQYGFSCEFDLNQPFNKREKPSIVLKYFDTEDRIEVKVDNFPLDIFSKCFAPRILENGKVRKFAGIHPGKIIVKATSDWQIPYGPIKDWVVELFNSENGDWLNVIITDGKVTKVVE